MQKDATLCCKCSMMPTNIGLVILTGWSLCSLAAWGIWLHAKSIDTSQWYAVIISMNVWLIFALSLVAVVLVFFSRCNSMKLQWITNPINRHHIPDTGPYHIVDPQELEMHDVKTKGKASANGKPKPTRKNTEPKPVPVLHDEEQALDAMVNAVLPTVDPDVVAAEQKEPEPNPEMVLDVN